MAPLIKLTITIVAEAIGLENLSSLDSLSQVLLFGCTTIGPIEMGTIITMVLFLIEVTDIGTHILTALTLTSIGDTGKLLIVSKENFSKSFKTKAKTAKKLLFNTL